MTTDKPKEEIIETSKVLYGEILYEQIYDSERKTSYYLGWDSTEEKIIKLEYIDHAPRKYIPIKDELLEKECVILPSDAIEYVSIQDLELEIDAFIHVWLDISDDHRQKSVWYIMLSWIIDKLNTIPYLRALGDYGTGKTRYLDVIGGLCYKPMFVGGSVRSAPICRVIDRWRGTLILDEFSPYKSDETQDIIQILNCGYQRGKPVLRCESSNYDKVKAFDSFGAKILATRKTFYDLALESRCITEILKETTRTDVPSIFTKEFYEKRQELQNKLLMFRFKNLEKIKPDESVKIDFGDIQPRIKQTFIPFTSLFQYDSSRLTEFIKYVQQYNRQVTEDNSTSFDGQIINHYFKLLENHNEQQQSLDDYHEPCITASGIRESMINDGWKEDVQTRTIGRRLKPLGFESRPMKIGGKTQRVISLSEKQAKRLHSRYVVVYDGSK